MAAHTYNRNNVLHSYRILTLGLVIILSVVYATTFYVFKFSPTATLFNATLSLGQIISPQQHPNSNNTLLINFVSPTDVMTLSNNDTWESSYNKPIHQLHPLKQFEYYKKWYSQFNFDSTPTAPINANNTSPAYIFNPFPAVPKQNTRLHQLYNISTKNIQFNAQFSDLLNDPNSVLHPRLTDSIIYKLKQDKNGIICDFNGKVFGIGMFKTGTKTLRESLKKLGYFGYYTERFWMPIDWYTHIMDMYRFSSDDISWMFYQSDIIKQILARSDISYSFGDGPWLFAYHLFDQYYSVPPKPKPPKTSKTSKPLKSQLQFEQQRKEHISMSRTKVSADGDYHYAHGDELDRRRMHLNIQQRNMMDQRGLDVNACDEYKEFEKIYGNLTNMDNGAKFVLTIRNSSWDVVNSDVKMKMRSQHEIDTGHSKS